MPNQPLIGAHMSTSKGLPAMVQATVDIGATCAQIFTSSPQQWRAKQYSDAEAEAFKSAWEKSGLGPIVAHDSYLINLASTDAEILSKSRQAFQQEIARCGQLGLPMVVTHLGAYKGGTLDEGLDCLAASLRELLPFAAEQQVQIVLETTAGQGTSIGGVFTQFPEIFSRIPAQAQLGVCLDLCHVFVAGYEMRDAESYAKLWQDFDAIIGLDRLQVIHANDTARALGSHSDRHAEIGKGILGMETFRLLMQDPRLAHIPKILETPLDDAGHGAEVALLKSLM